jgi:hypothetical protein
MIKTINMRIWNIACGIRIPRPTPIANPTNKTAYAFIRLIWTNESAGFENAATTAEHEDGP